MASDSLNEVGRVLKKSKDNSERALKKHSPNRPGVERTRDIFDDEVPFEMQFHVADTQKRVGLDLEFNKPPPMSDCLGAPCVMNCEAYDGLAAGDHELTVSNAYLPGTLAVYVNGATYSATKWAEISASAGTVLVTQLPQDTNTVSICYMQDCVADYDCEGVAAHGGVTGQEIYPDVWGAHMTSGGGCEWYVPPFLDSGSPTNFCYTAGPDGNGLIDSYGSGDPGVGGPGPIQPYGSPNNGAHWGMPATVWGGGTSKGTWTFSFPLSRLCGALISGFGGYGGSAVTVDYQSGSWDVIDGSFSSAAVVSLLPVVTDTITLYWEYSAPPGLQFYGGMDFTHFMVWGEQIVPEPTGYDWVLFDDFNRVQGPVSDIDNDFGYSLEPVQRWFGSADEWDIEDGAAHLIGSPNNGQQIQNPYVYPDYSTPVMPWQDGDWALKVRTKFHWADSEDQPNMDIGFNPSGGGTSDWITFSTTDFIEEGFGPWGYFKIRHFITGVGNEIDEIPFAYVNDAYYWVIAERTTTGILRAKLWLDGDTEPEDWMVSINTTSPTASTFYFIFDGSISADDEWWIDEIYFAEPSE